MRFEYTQEQVEFKERVRKFAEEKLKPGAAERDKSWEYKKIMKLMGEEGYLGVTVPKEYGGLGADSVCYVMAVEEISRACAASGVAMSVNNSLVCYPLEVFGTEEQKKNFLIPLARGEKIGSFALTEPEAGTDAANIKTNAVKRDGKYILNGTKIFITNGAISDVVIVFAMTDPSKRHRGISAFIVEKNPPSFRAGQLERKMGINASGTSELILEDCEVPEEQRLGDEGMGFKIAMATLDCGRMGIAAQAVGIAQAALDRCIEYLQENPHRAKAQNVQFKLAEIATRIEASRLLTYAAACQKDKKVRFSKEAAMAKLHAAETAVMASTAAVQIMGSEGTLYRNTVERFFRDAKITEIYEGTSEVQKMVVSASMLRQKK